MSALSGCEALTHRRQTWLKIETTGSLLLTGEALFPGSRGEDCGLGAVVWEGAVGPELEQRGAGLQDVLPGEPGTGCRPGRCRVPASSLATLPCTLPRSWRGARGEEGPVLPASESSEARGAA